MVRTTKTHQPQVEADDEDFGSRLTDEGKNGDRKSRSKHSETEQRRRSKINERFQILRELIPENDQKRDKATFLLEVIQYIQFLQERVQMFERTYQGWSSEPTKLTPWRSNCGAVESFVDPSHLMRSGPVNILDAPVTLTNTHNSIDSDFGCEATYRETDHGVASQEVSLGMSVPANLFEDSTAEPPQVSFSNTELLASESQPQLWRDRPCTTECATTSYTPDELEELNTEDIAISDSCSQGVLNTISHALKSSGVDLAQTSISVELDIAKHPDRGMTSMAFFTRDNKNLPPSSEALSHHGVGSSSNNSFQAHKRLRTEQS
ncbi:transcription factor BIM3 [Daucus carota subsp. sativus]|uniref:transcription factor BIM3 n=1 Tax=Daucus carota subsp. sativus TaxID=79200 RepID=UPI0007EFD7AD|nr:PREDICTED: transcription factor BIM3-like [Daucus carota subsp. sativus]